MYVQGTAGFAFLFLYSSFHAWLTLRARFLLASVCRKNAINCACSAGHRCFFFPLLLSSVTRTSRSLPACLRLTEKRWKIAPVLQIQASSMKLRVHGFLFLVSFSIRGCSILLLKKRKRALRPDSFFFNDSNIFKSILVLIISSLAIHYSQNVFRGFSILVCIGVQVFFRGFFFSLLLSRVTHSRARLALASVWPKNAEKLRLFCRSRPPQWN